MKKLNDLKFIKEITVWTLRKVEPFAKKFEKWEIGELDLVALTFNHYLEETSKFESDKDAENFVDSLNMDEIKELWEKMISIKNWNGKKK